MAPTKAGEDLYVADIRDVQTLDLSEYGVDVVVGVCQDSAEENVSCDYHFFCLSDGKPVGHCPGEYDYELFEDAVDVARDALSEGKTVLVHCHAGQSRSVSVAAVVLTMDRGYNLDQAYWHIRTTRDTNVHPDTKFLASKYVNRH